MINKRIKKVTEKKINAKYIHIRGVKAKWDYVEAHVAMHDNFE